MGDSHFTGLGGQLALLAELSFRGYAVAVPAPDEGDDVVVYDTVNGALFRIQVKTARSTRLVRSHQYQFAVRESQITATSSNNLYFAFIMRRSAVFHPLILSLADLYSYVQTKNFGTLSRGNRILTVALADTDDVTFGAGTNRTSLNRHLRDFSPWPEKITRDLPPSKAATAYSASW